MHNQTSLFHSKVAQCPLFCRRSRTILNLKSCLFKSNKYRYTQYFENFFEIFVRFVPQVAAGHSVLGSKVLDVAGEWLEAAWDKVWTRSEKMAPEKCVDYIKIPIYIHMCIYIIYICIYIYIHI